MTIEQEILSRIGEVIAEIKRLTQGDAYLNDSTFEDDTISVMVQSDLNFNHARIDTACAWLFIMLNDCPNFVHYQATTPGWLKQWHKDAEAWDLAERESERGLVETAIVLGGVVRDELTPSTDRLPDLEYSEDREAANHEDVT